MKNNNKQENEAQNNAVAELRLSNNDTINYCLSIRKKWKTGRQYEATVSKWKNPTNQTKKAHSKITLMWGK